MCGDSSRVSLGGLVAVIHPVPNSLSRSRRLSLKNCRLHLSNDSSERTLSQLHYDTDPSLMDGGARKLEVRIHHSGKLSYAPSCSPQVESLDQTQPANPIMHSFFIYRSAFAKEKDDAAAFTTLQRLNLGVGGIGVVGRTVSLLDKDQVTIGEGIIGWN